MSKKVEMLASTAQGFANAVKRLAVKDKKFAEELVYMHGIRSEITPNALKGITRDMFDKSGKLTESGKKEVTGLIKELNLPQNATWDDLLSAIKASKEQLQLPKPLDIKMPNFSKIAKKLEFEPIKFEPIDIKMPDFNMLAGKTKGFELPKFDFTKKKFN